MNAFIFKSYFPRLMPRDVVDLLFLKLLDDFAFEKLDLPEKGVAFCARLLELDMRLAPVFDFA